jgi:hypothetical protein
VRYEISTVIAPGDRRRMSEICRLLGSTIRAEYGRLQRGREIELTLKVVVRRSPGSRERRG